MLGKNLPFEERAAVVGGPLAPLAASLAATWTAVQTRLFVPARRAG